MYWLPDPMTQSAAVGMQDTPRIKVSRDSPVTDVVQVTFPACKTFLPAVPTSTPSGEHNNFQRGMSLCLGSTGVLISPKPDQEGNKLQRQKILIFICPVYNNNWRNISTIYIYIYIYIYKTRLASNEIFSPSKKKKYTAK